MSTHYVASLKIEKIDPATLGRSGQIETKREVSEVTHLTIKADTMESLVLKMSKHLAIIEES